MSLTSKTLTRALVLAVAALAGFAACDSSGTAEPMLPDVGSPWPASDAIECGDSGEENVDLLARLAANEVTYVTFAAKWCNACIEEAPVINSEVVDEFAGEPVEAIQILLEADPGFAPHGTLCTSWRDQLGARFSVMYDDDQELIGALFGPAIGQLPAHFIVTRDGTIRFRLVDAIPENLSQLVRDWLP